MMVTVRNLIRDVLEDIPKIMTRWAIRQHWPAEMAPGESVCMNCRRKGKPVPWPCEKFLSLDRHLDSLER